MDVQTLSNVILLLGTGLGGFGALAATRAQRLGKDLKALRRENVKLARYIYRLEMNQAQHIPEDKHVPPMGGDDDED